MPGFLQRLFTPRWRHNDPRIRQEAIAGLNVERDREKLETLLHDDNVEVRHAALERLATPERYRELLNTNDAGSPLHRTLLDTLTGRERTLLSLEQREQVVGTLTEPALLTHVTAHADNQQLRLAALARIEDEETLIEQACQNSIAGVRQAAASRIDTDEGLERLAREAKRDKQIMRSARDRLNQRREQRRDQDARQQRRDDLIQAMTRLSDQQWEPMLPARYRHLVREWRALAEDADESQHQRFHRVEQLTHSRVIEHDNAQREAQAREQAMDMARRDSQRIINSLNQALKDLEHRATLDAQDVAQLQAHFRLQAEQWRDLTDRIAPSQEDQKHFEALLQRASELTSAWQRFEEHQQALNDAIDQRDFPTIEQLKRTIAWPGGLPCPGLLTHLPEPAAVSDSAPAPSRPALDPDQFQHSLDQLESQLDRGELQEATRLLDSLMQRRHRLPADKRDSLQARLNQLGQRTHELRDWRNFAAAPKREQLIEGMEGLAAADMDEPTRDQQHRRMVRDWKALGDAAASRERSVRFRQASDQVREQLSAFHQRRDQQRENNMAERERLCEQLETLVSHTAATSDPDSLRTIRDRAREAWRQWSPVPRAREGELRQRFTRSLRALQTLIDQQARAVAQAKQALVDEIRELEESDIDDERRADMAKALQTRWRELGRAPRGEEQTLWRAFRQHCDAIFERRNAQRNHKRQQRDSRIDQMQALIDRLDGWMPESVAEQVTLDEAEKEADALMPLPNGPRTAGMLKRWEGILRDRRERLDRLALGTLAERWQQWQPLLEAHVEADSRALTGAPAENVEATLHLSPQAMEAHRLRNERRATGEQDKAREWLEHLRVHLSVLVDAPLGGEDSSRRLDVQVARLNDAMGNMTGPMEELEQLQCRLLASGPIDRDDWQRMAPRLETLMAMLQESDTDG
ncbi:hypothetical protein GCM10010082_21930 [Kushneria pakistanensis]|uniref:DUF349 domain-containing protein n=1 Tax=Kushneria pakistanensis TaxID=1508770 RepID=A0ABQ3FKY5_9GAMM|nr:DUF349 domain-containing protein [Kushneria pakistanensis]GHC28211.1 hypothetical protein GCM10010082_21930 [Kushneria pakistanensis]